MSEEDKLVLGTLAGVDLILSPEHYEEYKGTLNKQIEDLQQKVEQLEKEKNTLMYSLTLVRQKWNNDKARYRRKAKLYREERNQLEKENKILKENAEHNDKAVDKVNW